MLPYNPTLHALERMAQRHITDDDIHCTLGRGRIRIHDDGTALFEDVRTRVVAVVDLEYRRIITVWWRGEF